MHFCMEKTSGPCCAGCGSCNDVREGIYYYGKQLSAKERMDGSCCRTKQITMAFEIQGRESEPVCGGCVLRRRLFLSLAVVPSLAMMAFALTFPEMIPAHGPVRLGFFTMLAVALFPAWIWGRKVVARADELRDEVAAARARRRMRGKVTYERVNQGQIKGGLGGVEEWSGTTTMRNYIYFTRGKYRRMGGTDSPGSKGAMTGKSDLNGMNDMDREAP